MQAMPWRSPSAARRSAPSPDRPDALQWEVCEPAASRAAWHPKLARVFEYWLSIAPAGRLPGRQHFDPLDIPAVMPHVWMLDVDRTRDEPRFRYRLAGTREVETLQREVTGQWFDDVHRLDNSHPIYARFAHMLQHGVPTYRKGIVSLTHEKDHRLVENSMLPFATDGVHVDLIVACSIVFYSDGREVP